MRRNGSKPLRIGDVLQEEMKRRNIPVDCREAEIVAGWEKTVGPVIFQQTRPDKIANGTLYLKVSSPAWMQQLQFMKAEIIEKVNAALGKKTVGNIFFNVGQIETPVPKARKKAFVLDEAAFPLKPRDHKLMREALQNVKDPELESVIKRAMKKGIIRRRMLDEGKVR